MTPSKKRKERMKERKKDPGTITIGCNNGGGGRIFSKVKRLVAKWIGTWKWLFSGFLTARV